MKVLSVIMEKPIFGVIAFTTMLRQFRIVAVAILLLAAAGCGIKGPLVLPPAPAAKTEPEAAAPPAADSAKPDPAKSAAPAERKP
jgi:predicted small lipoprotein YifL